MSARSLPLFLPLRGVRVLTFEAAFSLPSGTRTLAELGADVVRISRPHRNQARENYITLIDGTALSKFSLALNLKHPEGVALARRLIARADAVCNNFRPRVLRALGLDEAGLRAIRPDLIILQLSGYGTPGPWQDYPAFGPSTEAAGGMNALSGATTDPPVRVGSGVFADQAGGRYAALALIAALVQRQRTGHGQTLDLSMAEAISHLLGDQLLCAFVTGRTPPRHGNRDPLIVPQGIYPCRGEDNWIAISVLDDGQWRALVRLTGDAELAAACYEHRDGRWQAHDAIDRRLATWTRGQDKAELAALLQAHGVAAGPVQKNGDLPFDPHLAARGAFVTVRHARPVLGAAAHPHLTTPWQARGYRRAALRDFAGDGMENAPVLARWLELDADEVARLERQGVLSPPTPLQLAPPAAAPGVPIDPMFAERLRLPKG